MATNKLERIYTIPLRSFFVKVPKYYRAKRAINQIRKFIEKHMKTEDVRIGNVLNEYVWSKGIRNPPGKVTVTAVKMDDYVTVELEGHTFKAMSVQTEKTEKPTSFKEKLAAKLKQPDSDKDTSKDDVKDKSKDVVKDKSKVVVKDAKDVKKLEDSEDSKDDSKKEVSKDDSVKKKETASNKESVEPKK